MFDILLGLFTSGGRNLSVDELESCRNGWNEKKWTRQEDYSLYCQGRRRLIGFVGNVVWGQIDRAFLLIVMMGRRMMRNWVSTVDGTGDYK